MGVERLGFPGRGGVAASCWVLRKQTRRLVAVVVVVGLVFLCGWPAPGTKPGHPGSFLILGGVQVVLGWCGVGVLVEKCIVDASIFVVKLLRANGGCLGTRSR